MGTTPRGFARWERARKNAEKAPNSGGAKLYRKRQAIAQTVSDKLEPGETTQVFDFYRYNWTNPLQPAIDFRVCSVHCAAMELQLKLTVPAMSTKPQPDSTVIEDALRVVLSGGKFHHGYNHPQHGTPPVMGLHDTTRQTKNVKCHVCNAIIQPNGYVWPVGTDPDAGEPFESVSSAALCDEIERLKRENNRLQNLVLSRTAQADRDVEGLRVALAQVAELERQVARLGAMAYRPSAGEVLEDLYVLQGSNNDLVKVLDLTVVHLDGDTARLLTQYSVPNLRWAYVNDYGQGLAGSGL